MLLNQIVRRTDNVFEVEYQGNIILVKMSNISCCMSIKEYLGLNQVEHFIWKCVLKPITCRDLVEQISNKFLNLTEDEIKNTILKLIDQEIISTINLIPNNDIFTIKVDNGQLSSQELEVIAQEISTPYTLSQTILLESLRRFNELIIPLNGDSMEPNIKSGSMVTIRGINPQHARVNDLVVCFKGADIIVHRLLQKVIIRNKLYIVTKGDNCNVADHPMEGYRLVAKVIKGNK